MADERIAFAGDLTIDALGRRVRVTTETGVVIEDELVDIRYMIDTRGRGLASPTGKPFVWLRFENAVPADAYMRGEGGTGFIVPAESTAQVGIRLVSNPEGK
jgi:hypothetical protein